MSAKGVRLERRTSGRPIPIEIARLAAGGGSQPHALEPRITAAICGEDRRSRRDVFDLCHEAAGADDLSAVEIFGRQRRADLVVPRRDVERLVLAGVGRAVWRVGRAEAMIERSLQRGRVIGCAVAGSAKTAVLHTHGIVISK
jgi:hypothetical protein